MVEIYNTYTIGAGEGSSHQTSGRILVEHETATPKQYRYGNCS